VSARLRFAAPPAEWPVLADGALHVWHVDLERVAAPTDGLDDAERARMARFYQALHRRRFGAAHSSLRRILARYLAAEPEDLVFDLGEHGKPALRGTPGGLAFNLSHSGDRALVAVTRVGPVGVDIEGHRALTDRDGLARRFFSPAEIQQLEGLPEEDRTAAFFRCWTRKEAFIKCSGRGLTQPLDSFDVSLEPDDGRVLHVRDPELGGMQWFMGTFDVGRNAEGAAIVRAGTVEVSAWKWAGG